MRTSVALALALALVALSHAPARAQETGPPREAIADYFAGVRADLYACGRGWHGAIEATITFERSGQPTMVDLDVTDVPDEVHRCVSGVLRGARMRAFSGPDVMIRHVIQL